MPRPWRALDTAGAAALVTAAALLGAAVLTGAAAPPTTVRLRTDPPVAGDPGDARSPVSWLLTPTLVRGPTDADLFLELRASDGGRRSGAPLQVRLEACAVAWRTATSTAPRCPDGAWTLLAATSIDARHPVHAGRVATVDRGEDAHLLATFSGRSGARLVSSTFRVSANVTPCAPARGEELWLTRRTRPTDDLNTLSGVAECATRPKPWLPLGLIVLAASLVLRTAAHRIRRPA